MTGRFKVIAATFAVAFVFGVAFVCIHGLGTPQSDAPDAGKTSEKPVQRIADVSGAKVAAVQPSAAPKQETGRRKRRFVPSISSESIDDREDLTQNEKVILKVIEKAVDDEDIDALRSILPEVMASNNSEIRSEAVDGLGWIGEKAVLDLLPFMADKDPEIAESAVEHWTSALADVGQKRRSTLVEETMKIVTDKDTLETIVNELDDCDEVIALQTLINIIASGNATAAEVAREEYEFITGEEYTTFEAAEAWLKENYESGDDDPGSDGDDGGTDDASDAQ